MADDSIFSRLPRASWFPDSGAIVYFPIKSVQENGGLRVTPRDRLYRPGAKQDDTGASADDFSTLSHFYNGLREAGQLAEQYPANLNRLIDALKLGAGTLTLPTRGPIRAKAKTWTRDDSDNKTDFAQLTIHWVANNEDGQTAATFFPPQARSAARSLAARTVRALQAEGAWSADVSLLESLCDALERASLAPTIYAGDVAERANAVIATIDRIKGNFMVLPRPSSPPHTLLLLSPSSWSAGRELSRLREVAARSRGATPGSDQVITVTYTVPKSLLDVATETCQPIEDLAGLNAGMPDQRFIEPGTRVLIRRKTARAA